ERREERQPLDVVPVEVGQEELGANGPAGRGEALAELTDPGARVEDQALVVGGTDLEARCVAAIVGGGGPGARDRAARAPAGAAEPRRRGGGPVTALYGLGAGWLLLGLRGHRHRGVGRPDTVPRAVVISKRAVR